MSKPNNFQSEVWSDNHDCDFRLAPLHVDVWKISVADHSDISQLVKCLSGDELDRANRFHREVIGFRFIKRRAALRRLLAKYLDTDASEILFRHNQFGKPYVVDNVNGRQIQFSSTSSENIALVAFTIENDVGCDVENRNRKVEFLSLAKRYFHPEETADIHSQESREQRSAFFHCWARKEAYVKALGKGLLLPLDSFRVNVLPEEPQLLWADSNVTNKSDWAMQALNPDPDYVGALMTAANVRQVRQFEFSWNQADSMET